MSFLDKMTVAIGSAGKDVARKAKDVSEVSRCTVTIEECEQNIKRISEEIGRYFYENAEGAIGEPYTGWFAQMDENFHTIGEMKERRRILKGIELCHACGAELRKDANFCNECGAPVERFPANSTGQARCPACGAILNGNEKFCGKCGTKIEERPQIAELPAEKSRCVNCGKELKEGAAFCQYCGTAVEKERPVSMELSDDSTEKERTEEA